MTEFNQTSLAPPPFSHDTTAREGSAVPQYCGCRVLDDGIWVWACPAHRNDYANLHWMARAHHEQCQRMGVLS